MECYADIGKRQEKEKGLAGWQIGRVNESRAEVIDHCVLFSSVYNSKYLAEIGAQGSRCDHPW